MKLVDNPKGNYRFLTGIAPYSSGVAADAGWEIIHATLASPIPYKEGFDLIDEHLAKLGRPRYALCAIELRSPKPFTFEGFSQFNQGYKNIVADWDLLVDGKNPIARTNVAPQIGPPKEPSLYAFSYTVSSINEEPTPTFVIAGAAELVEGKLLSEAIVRGGETTFDAIVEKATFVMKIMQTRLRGLKLGWSDVTAVDIYTAHPLKSFLVTTILKAMGQAVVHGIRWFYSCPPIIGLEFEMDMRGIRRSILMGS